MERGIDRVEGDFKQRRRYLFSPEFKRKIGYLVETITAYQEGKVENRNLASLCRALREFEDRGDIRLLANQGAFKNYGQKGMMGYLQKLSKESLPAADFRSIFRDVWKGMGTYFMNEMQYFVYTWLEIHRLIHNFYTSMKRSTLSIDFNDIELLALEFLGEISDFALFHSRIESKIRYVLIDEFQDTSELQWNALQSIVRNSLVRDGAFFYVGDVKQSIYRWRGGEPFLFQTVRKNLNVEERRLGYNYRQNAVLLKFVNTVFERIQELTEGQYPYERQLLSPGEDPKERGFVSVKKYRERESLIEELPSYLEMLSERGVMGDDIAILCRKNSEVEEIEKLLRLNRISFNSAGKTRLLEDYCIRDLFNVICFVLSPEEEIYLTALLRAPFFRRSYEQILGLRKGEEKITLRQIAKIDPSLLYRIEALVSASKYSTPSGFIGRLFEELDVFNTYREKTEALIEFLELAYSFENDHDGVTLPDFARWLEQNKEIIPLRVNRGAGVTIQTIHASKGLEYHTVILPFLFSLANLRLDGSLMYSKGLNGKIKNYALAARRYLDFNLDREGIARIREENDLDYKIDELNILYVALTRARENLLILPLEWKNRTTIGELLLSGCDPNYTRKAFPYGWERGSIVPSQKPAKRPEWKYVRVGVRAEVEQPSIPTFEIGPKGQRKQRRGGLLKGTLVHGAIEMIRALPVDEETLERNMRSVACREGQDYTNAEKKEAMGEAKKTLLNVIADQRLAKYFINRAVGELTIFSEKFQNLLGRIDRIYIGEEIEIIDFKTNPVEGPQELIELIGHYREQVDTYCSVLSSIYTKRRVRGFLYFTEVDYGRRLVPL
jgi:exodeoxyribonuclease V beta subunit